jgi:hypothetical protein
MLLTGSPIVKRETLNQYFTFYSGTRNLLANLRMFTPLTLQP